MDADLDLAKTKRRKINGINQDFGVSGVQDGFATRKAVSKPKIKEKECMLTVASGSSDPENKMYRPPRAPCSDGQITDKCTDHATLRPPLRLRQNSPSMKQLNFAPYEIEKSLSSSQAPEACVEQTSNQSAIIHASDADLMTNMNTALDLDSEKAARLLALEVNRSQRLRKIQEDAKLQAVVQQIYEEILETANRERLALVVNSDRVIEEAKLQKQETRRQANRNDSSAPSRSIASAIAEAANGPSSMNTPMNTNSPRSCSVTTPWDFKSPKSQSARVEYLPPISQQPYETYWVPIKSSFLMNPKDSFKQRGIPYFDDKAPLMERALLRKLAKGLEKPVELLLRGHGQKYDTFVMSDDHLHELVIKAMEKTNAKTDDVLRAVLEALLVQVSLEDVKNMYKKVSTEIPKTSKNKERTPLHGVSSSASNQMAIAPPPAPPRKKSESRHQIYQHEQDDLLTSYFKKAHELVMDCPCANDHGGPSSCTEHEPARMSRKRRTAAEKFTRVKASHRREKRSSVSAKSACSKRLSKKVSTISGWGCFADEPIRKGEFIAEYVGEILDKEEAEHRQIVYNRRGHSFLFDLNDGSERIIDGTRFGNVTKFINSSPDSNTFAEVFSKNGENRLGLYASKNIAKDEELTYDYQDLLDDHEARGGGHPSQNASA